MENKKHVSEDDLKELMSKKEAKNEPDRIDLGRAASYIEAEHTKSVIEENGWIRLKPNLLPSQGMFYPAGTDITIRAASAGEIRQWSTLDEDDILSLDDALNRIVDKCCRVRFPSMMGSFKDLKEIDRFYVIFAIREYTFKRGENILNADFSCKGCGKAEKSTIVKEMLSYYTPVDELQTRFSETERCFHLKLVNGEEIRLYLPTLGVMSYIKGYIREKNQNREEYDQAFIKWAPFLFPDWRVLNPGVYTQTLQDSYIWSNSKISVIDWFVDKMQKTVKAELKKTCSSCGVEVTAPIMFPGGVKSLFLISDITSLLL